MNCTIAFFLGMPVGAIIAAIAMALVIGGSRW